MRKIVFSLVAATVLLASVGAAFANGPVKLTDVQLDKVTAGDAPTASSLLAASTTELNNLLTISSLGLGLLTGTLLPTPALSALSSFTATP
jgi:hypothetical protein